MASPRSTNQVDSRNRAGSDGSNRKDRESFFPDIVPNQRGYDSISGRTSIATIRESHPELTLSMEGKSVLRKNSNNRTLTKKELRKTYDASLKHLNKSARRPFSAYSACDRIGRA